MGLFIIDEKGSVPISNGPYLFQKRERKVVMGKHKKIERMKEIDRRRKRREERVKQKAREQRASSQPSRSSA